MAAIPSTLLSSVQSVGQTLRDKERGDGETGTRVTVASNELGARSFFPTSEVTSMPTLKLRHTHKPTAGLPTLHLKGSVNDEHCSAGVGVTANIGGTTVKAATRRMLQREGVVQGGVDKGWAHSMGVKLRVGGGVVRGKVVKLTTDSGDKEVVEGKVIGVVEGGLGMVRPEVSWVSRAAQGADERRTGKKFRLLLESSPLLNAFRATIYGVHTLRRWDPSAASYSSNELGFSLPIGTSRFSLGGIQTNAGQSELLEQSTCASVGTGDSRLGLTFKFESQL